MFYKFKQVLIDKAGYPYTSDNVQQDLRLDIDGVLDAYYPLQRNKDICFEVARLLMGIKDYEHAVELFLLAISLVGRLGGGGESEWMAVGVLLPFLCRIVPLFVLRRYPFRLLQSLLVQLQSLFVLLQHQFLLL